MIHYDLTTSSQWGGRSVGIVRVERELFRALRSIVGQDGLSAVLYHHPTRLFYRVRPDIVGLIASGRATIDFNFDLPEEIRAGVSACFDHPSMDAVCIEQLKLTAAWATAQIESVSLSFQEDWLTRPIVDGFGEKKWWIPFLSAVDGVASVIPGEVIFSAGLDWDHKDNRAIRLLKEAWGFRYISFVYDLVPVNMPQFVVPAIRDKISGFFSDLVWVADGYVCSAKAVSAELDVLVRKLTNNSGEIVQIPFGAPPAINRSLEEDAEVLSTANLIGKQYLLYVSTVEPRKNHKTLYMAWKRGIEIGSIDPEAARLVFLGMPGWLSEDLLESVKADRTLKGSIIILSGLSDESVDSLYRGCVATVFPSFGEGYGLALTEAHVRGKWVLASTRPAIPEVAGDGADYIDPDDVLGWQKAMSSCLSSPRELRAKEKLLSKRTATTWKAAASALLATGILKPWATQ